MDANSLWGAHATLAELIIARDEKSNRIVYTKVSAGHEVETPCRAWNKVDTTKGIAARGLCCWHDTYELERDRVPVFLPVSHDDARRYFWVFGRFCSFACAVKFAFEHQYIRGQYTLMLLKLMAVQVYGMSIDEVNAPEGPFVPAPCRESLDIFGNNGLSSISIKVFRDMVLAGKKPPLLPEGVVRQTSSLRLPPFISTDNVNYDVYSKQRIANYEAVYLYKSFSDKMPHVIVANMVRSGGNSCPAGSVCWQDTEPLPDGVLPMGIPLAVSPSSVFQVFGAFCSANCMLAYLNDKLSWNTDELQVLVHRMCWEVFQLPSSLIAEQAPPAWDLRKFGGTMTIDEYRAAAANQVQLHAHSPIANRLASSVQWVTMSIEYQSNILPPNHASLRTIGVMMASTMMDAEKDISLDSSIFTKFMGIDQGDKSIISDATREALHDKIFARSKKKPKKTAAASRAGSDDKVDQNAKDAK